MRSLANTQIHYLRIRIRNHTHTSTYAGFKISYTLSQFEQVNLGWVGGNSESILCLFATNFIKIANLISSILLVILCYIMYKDIVVYSCIHTHAHIHAHTHTHIHLHTHTHISMPTL